MSHAIFDVDPKLRELIAEFATGDAAGFDASTPLTELGLDSLARVRLVVRYVPDDDQEIDAAVLGGLRTVGDLQVWLASLVPAEESR